MAVIYPRTLPGFVRAQACRFELQHEVSQSETVGGDVLSDELADSWWRFDVSTKPLLHADAAALAAWWESMGGGLESFLAHDFRHPQLAAYPAGVTALPRSGGGTFDGTALVAAIAATVLTIGATGGKLPAALQFRAGDKLGLISNHATPRYFVHRVLEDVAADAGGVAVLSVWPPVNAQVFAAGHTANVVKPVCEFVPDPESWSYDPGLVESGISFAGMSRLY